MKSTCPRASLFYIYLIEKIRVSLIMISVWDRCLQLLRAKVNKHTMSTWLEPIACEEISERTILLSAPTNFHVAWIRDNYLNLISESVGQVFGNKYEIDFLSRNEFDALLPESAPPGVAPDRASIIEAFSITDEFARKHKLNPRYTFESFVVGSCNQFANAAAVSVSENLGGTYNPLFIYGGVGLGKTHLMSAIGYDVLSKDKSAKVSFSTSEEFTNEMINAIRYDKMVDFRNKYRCMDLLLIDDIQFLAGKERTQEEFFHTFNRIYEDHKQIVITADCLPNELDIEQRLKSRFGWGLVADISAPDLETKVAILKRKAFEDSLELPDDVAHFLARQVGSNIRELEGLLVRVVAMSTLQGIPLTKELAEKALKDVFRSQCKPITMEAVISAVAKAFNVKVSDIKSKKRHKLYSFPRQVAMYLARELTECSYPEIGVAFGGKDHSTVIHAVRKIEKTMEKDQSLTSTIDGLRREIRA